MTMYVFLQWLSLISGTKLLEINKHATWIDALSVSVLRLFSTPHFSICHFLLRHCGICYLSIFPSCRKWSWTAGENGIKMSKVQDRMLSNQTIKRVPFPIAMPRGVRVLIEVSRVYFFYVDLFIYLFIYFFRVFKANKERQTRKRSLFISADRLIVIKVYF